VGRESLFKLFTDQLVQNGEIFNILQKTRGNYYFNNVISKRTSKILSW